MPDETFQVDDFPEPPNPDDEREPVDPIYERQQSLNLSKPSVILVGAGGVGCWIALALTLGGIDDMKIFDGDTLSLHNLNRFPLSIANVGELKSTALAKWLRSLRPNADITGRGMFDPNVAHGGQVADWLICATDSLKSRRMCYKHSIENGMKYLEVGADGERWTLSPRPPEFSTDLEDNPGYQSIPVHVGPCMMAGAAVSYYVLHNQVPPVSHLVNWDKGPDIKGPSRMIDNHPKAALSIASMDESQPITCPLVTCPKCKGKVQGDDIIYLIKHLRMCDRTLDLVTAKEIAEKLMAEIRLTIGVGPARWRVVEDVIYAPAAPEADRVTVTYVDGRTEGAIPDEQANPETT